MLDDNDSTTTTPVSPDPVSPDPASRDSVSPDPGPAPAEPDGAPSPGQPAPSPAAGHDDAAQDTAGPDDPDAAPAAKRTARKTTRKAGARTTKKTASAEPQPSAPQGAGEGAALGAEQLSGADQTADPTIPLELPGEPGPVEPGPVEPGPVEPAPGEVPTAAVPARKAAAKKTAAKKATTKKATTKKAAAKKTAATKPTAAVEAEVPDDTSELDVSDVSQERPAAADAPVPATSLLFKAPDPVAPPRRKRAARVAAAQPEESTDESDDTERADVPSGDAAGTGQPSPVDTDSGDADSGDTDSGDTDSRDADSGDADSGDTDDEQGGNRRRRRRGGRRRRRGGTDNPDDPDNADNADSAQGDAVPDEDTEDASPAESGSRSGEEQEDEGQDASQAGQGGRSGQRTGGQRGSGQRTGQKGSGRGGQSGGQRGSGPDRSDEQEDSDAQDESTGSRRRRRRRRTGDEGDGGSDDPQHTVVRVRKPRNVEDEITSLHGSTRLEAKKQRRREGREAGRRRAPIVSEAEFLARREAVDRLMVIRQRDDLTQIAVLEDDVLVEHYVARESQTSLIGNVYLGRVQNVLPSMEAAFIDIGKGRNAVLYAGEVNWDSLGAGNGPRKIEQVLKSGQPILVQVSKDPIGHKGARLTSQVSLPGRFLVYVPDGTTSGISRKLPDTERSRLKTLLKEIVPDTAGVIVRTAAEGASEDELTLDVERLTARWSDIERKVEKGNAPQLLYGEPDLTLKVVRDLFTEDFAKLVVSGDEAWDMVDGYVKHVAPDLEDRLERYAGDEDVFGAYRIDEQIAKGLDRKVWLPSGGSLVIDRTEAMTVVDVNTGKFTGSGGNLEETVTKNNLEAAEEIVRQLRLRDIGGIIVVDFIDMVLEGNRDLVLRRLVECLGRDRTRHQVAEVTSLGLVQMTRKRIGTGLLEAFSETCDHCQGRGVLVHHEPVEPHKKQDDEPRRGRRARGRGGDGDDGAGGRANGVRSVPSPKDIAAIAKHEPRPVDESLVTAATGSDPAAQASPPVAESPTGTGDAPGDEPLDASGGSTWEMVPDAVPEAVPDLVPDLLPDLVPDLVPDTGDPSASRADEPTSAEPAAFAAPTPEPGDLTEPAEPAAHAAPVEPADLTEPVTPGTPAGPAVPAGPRLVTSTRRRVARRPAGPPSGGPATAVVSEERSAQNGSPDRAHPEDGDDGDAGLDVTDERDTPAEHAHVPVKKRGRKH